MPSWRGACIEVLDAAGWRIGSSVGGEATVPLQDVSQLVTLMLVAAVTCLAILLVVAARKSARAIGSRRRSRFELEVRPMLLAAAADEGIAPQLLRARGARGWAVDRLALEYLARTGGSSHLELQRLVGDRGVTGRMARRSAGRGRRRRSKAVEALGVIGSPAALRCLEELAVGAALEERVVVTRSLGLLGTPEAAEVLLRSLDHPDPVPQGIVASALLAVGPDAVGPLRAALGFPGAGSRLRGVAAEVLGHLQAFPAWRELAVLVDDDPDPEVRVRALLALGRLGVPESSEAVSRALAPGRPSSVRAAAAWALGRIGDARWSGVLAEAVADPDYPVAHHAAAALVAIGPVGHDALVLLAGRPGLGSLHAREALALAHCVPHSRLAWRAGAAPEAIRAAPAAPMATGR